MEDSIFNIFDQQTDQRFDLSTQHKENFKTDLKSDLKSVSESDSLSWDLYVLLDDEYEVRKRVRYGFWQALSDVGGVHDALSIIVRVFFGPLAANYFQQDLVKKTKQEPPISIQQRQKKEKAALSMLKNDSDVAQDR